MAHAITARRDGDAFQSRHFWLKALHLLDPDSPIIRVGFETGPKGFDDIWVEYDPNNAPPDHKGNPLQREHIQCKWHVKQGDYGYADLANPEFINASTQSFLQRARAAQLVYAPEGIGIYFKLLTNWQIGRTDPLREMVKQRHGNIQLEKLFGTKTDQSAAGKIRKLWREHLSIDEEELGLFSQTLSFGVVSDTLSDLRERVDQSLRASGLQRISPNESAFLYDDLPFQWQSQGKMDFDRETFHDACKREGLFENKPSKSIVFGIKSFEHAFNRLEDCCKNTLNLIQYFDDRPIRKQQDWETTLYPQLKTFLLDAAKGQERLRLILDTHITLAFAAGSILNIKSGIFIELEQRTIGRNIWHSEDCKPDMNWPTWDFETKTLSAEKKEVAVVVGLTHDIEPDVSLYINNTLPNIGKILVAKLSCGPSVRSVECGHHAFNLAETLAFKINKEKQGVHTHLFVAGPNAFTFFLGQRQPGLGNLTLYEFDFENLGDGTYAPSLSLPV